MCVHVQKYVEAYVYVCACIHILTKKKKFSAQDKASVTSVVQEIEDQLSSPLSLLRQGKRTNQIMGVAAAEHMYPDGTSVKDEGNVALPVQPTQATALRVHSDSFAIVPVCQKREKQALTISQSPRNGWAPPSCLKLPPQPSVATLAQPPRLPTPTPPPRVILVAQGTTLAFSLARARTQILTHFSQLFVTHAHTHTHAT